jgi:hypothetical protein
VFTWTVEKLLCALDAGIESVVTEYNAQYAHVVSSFGTDVLRNGRAHAMVQAQMVADLDFAEVPDESFEGPLYVAVWETVTDAPDNFGIERFPEPMFSRVIAA